MNLFLEVIARRRDGFHEIETLMLAVDLCDTLEFSHDPASAAGRISFHCRWAHNDAWSPEGTPSIYGRLPDAEHNLALRALRLLQQQTGSQCAARISLVKRIPAEAGLGGASSDAAGALAIANVAWGLRWPHERLASLAAELGSDVPFFLQGGLASARGRGEQLEPLSLRPPSAHLVIYKPPCGLSTAQVYHHSSPPSHPRSVQPLLHALVLGRLNEIAKNQWNRLEEPAWRLQPAVRQATTLINQCGARGSQMSGSGSSVFGWCLNARHARRVAARIRQQTNGAVFVARTWPPHRLISAA